MHSGDVPEAKRDRRGIVSAGCDGFASGQSSQLLANDNRSLLLSSTQPDYIIGEFAEVFESCQKDGSVVAPQRSGASLGKGIWVRELNPGGIGTMYIKFDIFSRAPPQAVIQYLQAPETTNRSRVRTGSVCFPVYTDSDTSSSVTILQTSVSGPFFLVENSIAMLCKALADETYLLVSSPIKAGPAYKFLHPGSVYVQNPFNSYIIRPQLYIGEDRSIKKGSIVSVYLKAVPEAFPGIAKNLPPTAYASTVTRVLERAAVAMVQAATNLSFGLPCDFVVGAYDASLSVTQPSSSTSFPNMSRPLTAEQEFFRQDYSALLSLLQLMGTVIHDNESMLQKLKQLESQSRQQKRPGRKRRNPRTVTRPSATALLLPKS